MLVAFDAPIPHTTTGARAVSNVPAQALILLNDPFVVDQARVWGAEVAASNEPVRVRIESMFVRALGRPPTQRELDSAERFLSRQSTADNPAGWPGDASAWAALAHAIFNLKEFCFIN